MACIPEEEEDESDQPCKLENVFSDEYDIAKATFIPGPETLCYDNNVILHLSMDLQNVNGPFLVRSSALAGNTRSHCKGNQIQKQSKTT